MPRGWVLGKLDPGEKIYKSLKVKQNQIASSELFILAAVWLVLSAIAVFKH